jgi:membrane protein implicated in regulation of membrane protease activity
MGLFENITLVWFIAGVIFLVMEAITPGFFLIFFGLGAWAVAIANFITPLSSASQWGIFIVVSLVSLLALRKRLKTLLEKRSPKGDSIDDPVFSGQYIGREVVVLKEIAPGLPGLVELNGSNWQARTEGQASFQANDRVTVRGLDGLTLIVEK